VRLAIGNPKKMWDILNYIFRNKFTTKTDQIPDQLKTDSGQLITNPIEILETMNEYFTSVAEKLKNDLLRDNCNRIAPDIPLQ